MKESGRKNKGEINRGEEKREGKIKKEKGRERERERERKRDK